MLSNQIEVRDLIVLVSGAAHPHFMTHRQRWELLISSLLNHPKMPLGGRLKDHPFTLASRRYLDQFKRLNSKPVLKGKRSKTGSIFSRYVALMIITRYHYQLQVQRLTPSDRGDFEEDFFERAIQRLVDDLAYQLAHDTPEDCNAVTSLFRRQLYDLLNLRSNSRFIQRAQNIRYVSITRGTKQVDLSRDLANVRLKSLIDQMTECADHASTIGHSPDKKDPAVTEQLSRVQMWVISIKTKKVQTLLEECKSHFIRRGASVWCAHALSLVRESLLTHSSGSPLADFTVKEPFLILDSSAVLKVGMIHLDESFSIPAPAVQEAFEASLANALQAHLTELLSRSEVTLFDELYPSLRRWRLHAIKQPEEHRITSILPEFRVNARCVSLLDFCTERRKYDSKRPSDPVNCSFKSMGEALIDPSRECEGRLGEMAFKEPAFSTPINYSQLVGNDKVSKQLYGWSSVVFALVGISYRRSIDDALVRRINSELSECDDFSLERSLRVPKGWRDRLEDRHEKHNQPDDHKLILVKLDGDRVGERFVTSTPLEQLHLSQSLESFGQQLYWSSCQFCFETLGIKYPHVDLIYFGGDDLEVLIREDAFEEMIEQIAEQLTEPDVHFNVVSEVFFSFVAVRFTYDEDSRDQLSMISDDLNLLLKSLVKRPKGSDERPQLNKKEKVCRTRSNLHDLSGDYTVSELYTSEEHAFIENETRLYGALFDATHSPSAS